MHVCGQQVTIVGWESQTRDRRHRRQVVAWRVGEGGTSPPTPDWLGAYKGSLHAYMIHHLLRTSTVHASTYPGTPSTQTQSARSTQQPAAAVWPPPKSSKSLLITPPRALHVTLPKALALLAGIACDIMYNHQQFLSPPRSPSSIPSTP